MRPVLGISDIILGPLFFFGILIVGFFISKLYPKDIRQFLIWGLSARMVGGLLQILVTIFYFGYGDTRSYFLAAETVSEIFYNGRMDVFFDLYSTFGDNYSANTTYFLDRTFANHMFYQNRGFVTRTAGLFGLICNHSFIPISFMFSAFAFFGSWNLFRVAADIQPNNKKFIGIATLFVPSVLFFAAGILKDPLCIFGIGIIINGIYFLFKEKKPNPSYLIKILLGLIVVINIKPYIIIGFVVALLIWLVFSMKNKIHNFLLRQVFMVILGIFSFGVFYVAYTQLTARFEYLSADNVVATTQRLQTFYNKNTAESNSSGYNLGEINPGNPLSLLAFFPKAVNVSLFRPYPWEWKKIINIPLGIESMFLLLFTIRLFFRYRNKVFKVLRDESFVAFCLYFSIIMAFIVGVGTGNFGSLARYRTIFLSFYFLFIFMVDYNCKKTTPELLEENLPVTK